MIPMGGEGGGETFCSNRHSGRSNRVLRITSVQGGDTH